MLWAELRDMRGGGVSICDAQGDTCPVQSASRIRGPLHYIWEGAVNCGLSSPDPLSSPPSPVGRNHQLLPAGHQRMGQGRRASRGWQVPQLQAIIISSACGCWEGFGGLPRHRMYSSRSFKIFILPGASALLLWPLVSLDCPEKVPQLRGLETEVILSQFWKPEM